MLLISVDEYLSTCCEISTLSRLSADIYASPMESLIMSWRGTWLIHVMLGETFEPLLFIHPVVILSLLRLHC